MAAGTEDRWRRAWWALLVGALAGRLVLAVVLETNGDLQNLSRVGDWLREAPLELYIRQGPSPVWPYLTGYLPVPFAAEALHDALGLAPHVLLRLPVIAATGGLVWVVDRELGRRGAGPRERLGAAAVLLLAPLLVLEAGWHGQLDLVATLAAVAGVVAWSAAPPGRRARTAGLLVGGAAAIKTPLGVLLLALLPHARDRRELAELCVAAVAVPLIAVAPWLVHDAAAVREVAGGYRGLLGIGGLSLVVQPSAAELWLNGAPLAVEVWQLRVQDRATALALLGLAAAALVVARTRPDPPAGAVLVLLAVYATAANWALHYTVWLVPFLLLARWTLAAAAVQAVITIPTVLVFLPAMNGTLATPDTPWSTTVTRVVYVPTMLALWAATVAGFLVLARREWLRTAGSGRARATAASQP